MAARSSRAHARVRLRPHDPFDLIRLLARSQADPRKAVAELVQNALDAGARRVEITWSTEQGRRALRIRDDGEGVFPEMEREEALRRIARTMGHSHKRDLSPAQRREQMVLGKYGIGLIGFWSVGEVLEMKSRVGGGRAWVLRLRENRAQGEVFPSRARLLGEEETFTEVAIRGVHEAAVAKIRPPRLQAYLASELRGQLLEREATVRIHDRVARGRARKEFVVEPRPYVGRPIEELLELEVPGFEAARLELYVVSPDEERRGVVSLSCGGTVVLDDVAEIDGIDVPRAPWSTGRLEGVIDFPDLHVAPGTRRGFSHDEPVAAFLGALEELERRLAELLSAERRRRAEARSEHLAREIRRAFRSVAERLPEYDFFAVRRARDAPEPSGEGRRAAPEGSGKASAAGEPLDGHGTLEQEARGELRPAPPSEPEPPDDRLFPPGPLARLALEPRSLRLAPLASRGLRARALDQDGRPCAGEVRFAWSLEGVGELAAEGERAVYRAPAEPEAGPGRASRIRVAALQGEVRAEASASVHLLAEPEASTRVAGIPEPRPVTAPGEPWRSRLVEGVWEYNEAHRDYLAVAEVEAKRLRYLIHLFAKEVVLRNFGRPGDGETLEHMVEVLTWLDAERKR